jgi:sugar/nucleoside kinase (ribokinase family)
MPPIDYLLVGHVTQDLTPHGPMPGGTAAYAGLTARALGARPGLVTSFASGAALGQVGDLDLSVTPCGTSTVFENTYTPAGRVQKLVSTASHLDLGSIPLDWRSPRVVHLGPVADEVDPGIALAQCFAGAFVGATPQGWMRTWDSSGTVRRKLWDGFERLGRAINAVVLSEEDIDRDEAVVGRLAATFEILVVTRGSRGARMFHRGEPVVEVAVRPRVEVDPTGAGDVFAACFFWLVAGGTPPAKAASTACEIAGDSVERHGLEGVPGPDRRPG